MGHRLTISIIWLICGTLIGASPLEVTQTEVNGIPTYLLNTHRGNGVTLSVAVFTGALHDDPAKQAGRAHLWEHFIHRGSLIFPDAETHLMTVLEPRMGGGSNAYTSNNLTYYHYHFHPDAFEDVSTFLGAMISQPDWQQSAFETEKQVVKNEALEYQGRDSVALDESIFLHLLPEGHPLAMYSIGAQEQLQAMTMADLQALYEANFAPEELAIIVGGNFDAAQGGSASSSAILESLRRHFHGADGTRTVPRELAARKKQIPPLTVGEEPKMRWIELGTKKDIRALELVFEVDPALDFGEKEVIETLNDYLQLKFDNSFVELLASWGWVTTGGVRQEWLNNRSWVSMYLDLTQLGARHREEIPDVLFSVLHNLSVKGLEPELLEFLRQRNILSYEYSLASHGTSADLFANGLAKGVSPSVILDFNRRYGTVTDEDLRRAAALTFQPSRMLAGYMGPDVESLQKSRVFQRPYILVDRAGTAIRWQRCLSEGGSVSVEESTVKLVTVPLEFSKEPRKSDAEQRYLFHVEDGEQRLASIAVEEDHRSTNGALSLVLGLAPHASAQEEASLHLWLQSFQRRYSGELEYLSSLNLLESVAEHLSGVQIELRGNSLALEQALLWLLKALRSYEPLEEEFQYALKTKLNSWARKEQQMTARVAAADLTRLMSGNHYLYTELSEAAKILTLEKVVGIVRGKFEKVDVELTLAGDHTRKGAKELVQGIRKIFPDPLPTEQNVAVRMGRDLKPDGPLVAYWHTSNGEKPRKWWQWWGRKLLFLTSRLWGHPIDVGKYGIARVFRGPELLSREHAAMHVLQLAMGPAVYMLNRGKKNLGYVHDVKSLTVPPYYILMYGQSGVFRAREIERGWQDVLRRIAESTLSPDDFELQKLGIARSEGIVPVLPEDVVAQLERNAFVLGDVNATQLLLETLTTLTSEEIYSVGRRYLSENARFADVIVTSKRPASCATVLTSSDRFRAQL